MRLVAYLLVLIPSVAHAQWQSFEPRAGLEIGAEAGVGIVRSDSNPFSPGPAITVRGGYQFANRLVPEMEFGFAYWTGSFVLPSTERVSISEVAVSAMPGLRWGWVSDRIFTGVSAHLGYGYLQASAGGQSVSDSGFALELGFDLALQMTREVTIGPHFSIEKIVVSKSGSVETGELWFQLGLGASFNLP
jgi:hypothetical protein